MQSNLPGFEIKRRFGYVLPEHGRRGGRARMDGAAGKYKRAGNIRYSKKVAESTFTFKPIYEYSPCCGAAQDYKKFVTEYTGKAR